MGEHITARPTGPSYVPGTLKGQSSPNAPAVENNLAAQTTAPAAPLPPATSAVPANPVNPAQTARTKFAAPAPGSAISNIKIAGQPIRMPGTIGSVNTGFRRFSG